MTRSSGTGNADASCRNTPMVITFQPVNQRSDLAGCAGFGIQHAGRHTWVTRPTVQRPVTAPKSHGGRLGRDRDRCRIIGDDAVTPAAARVCAQISNRSCERERQRLSCGRSVQPEQHHVGQALGQIRLEGFVGEHCPHMQSPASMSIAGRGWTPGGSSPRSTARRTTVSANANRDAHYRSGLAPLRPRRFNRGRN